ncbi:hypothetical protein G7054_g11019 [Neopestalotiopsis clavispora]|nr:hypothetical protein G7054_g11019 [Neopestalotiopsis clavispora]
MAGSRLVSDLVRDSKIETEWLDSCLRHIFYDTGPSAKQRRVRREEKWVRQDFVGEGAFGRVYLEQCRSDTSERLRAVKQVKKSSAPGEEFDYMRELEAVAKFSHQNYSHCFVQSHGWFERGDFVFISMEYLVHGDLQRHLQAPLKESETKQITSQVLEGLTFMHDNGFVHRDLKPGNIMVVSKDPEWFVKITDFGISKRRLQDVTTLRTLQRGTLGFVAPEVLENLPDTSYTFSVDMWSLGAVVYRILTNTIAFQNVMGLVKFCGGMSTFPIHALESRSTSKEAQDFILKLMKPSPEERLSARSAAQHSWVFGNSQNDSASDGTQSQVDAMKFQVPVEAKPALDSMASKAWSMDSDAIPTLRMESSASEIGINTSKISEASAAVDVNNVESNPPETAIGPLVSEVRGRLEYEKPSIDDIPEDKDLLPKLTADTPFVLETMRASGPEVLSAKLDPKVTIETDTALPGKMQSNEPFTSKFEDSVKHHKDRTYESPFECSTPWQEPFINDNNVRTDQSDIAEDIDDDEPTSNGHVDDASNINTDTHSHWSSLDKTDQLTEETSVIIQKALETRQRIEDLEPMGYISFDEMWNHWKFLAASDNYSSREQDTNDHSLPSGPLDELEYISSHFNSWILPQCFEFSANPPTDDKKCVAEHQRLSETIMQQILLKLDEIDVGGDLNVRNQRKELVNQVQTVLMGIDQKLPEVSSTLSLRPLRSTCVLESSEYQKSLTTFPPNKLELCASALHTEMAYSIYLSDNTGQHENQLTKASTLAQPYAAI